MSNARNLGNLANNVSADGRLMPSGCSGVVSTSLGGFQQSLTTYTGGVIYGTGSGFACTQNLGATSGQVLLSGGAGIPFWGALPAAELTQLSSGSFMMGMSSITISPLILSNYKFLYIYISNLNCMMTYGLTIGTALVSNQSNATSAWGMIMLDLVNNTGSATLMRTSGSGVSYLSGTTGINQMTGSITIGCSPTTFTSGTYVLYGQP